MYLSTFNLVETKILIFISPDRRNLNRGSCCTPNFDLRYHLPSASLHCKCFDLLILKIHNFFKFQQIFYWFFYIWFSFATTTTFLYKSRDDYALKIHQKIEMLEIVVNLVKFNWFLYDFTKSWFFFIFIIFLLFLFS